ncbi:MAG: ABC transporter permease [Chloroflexi bacterium]|jgi:ABC-2 type transport system permease protein|nr:ABC transporter permease [Chloroflexota bacterium]
MFNSRLSSIIRKEFIQIWRDPRTLMLALLIPIMQLFLLGYAATNDVRNLPMAVFDQDRGPAARALLDAYRAADYFAIAFDVDSEAEIRDLIEAGEARLGMIIPPNYSTLIQGSGQAEIFFIFDGSDPAAASTALAAAQQIGWQFGTKIQQERLSQAGIPISTALPLEVRTQVWYNPDLIDAYFMVPAIIGMILFAITSILTATTIVRERERGTMEQLIVTPIRPWELVVGKLLPYVILAMTNTVEVLVIGSWWFHVPIRGSLTLILLLSGLFLITSLSIGLLASTIANTQQEAMLTVWMLLLPTLFLSGFFFPLEAMPLVLRWISYVLPLRYYLVIIRSLMLKGASVLALKNEIIALTIFGIVLMSAAAVRFRKRLD